RRHTILVSDWSSDVCSSDLVRADGIDVAEVHGEWIAGLFANLVSRSRSYGACDHVDLAKRGVEVAPDQASDLQCFRVVLVRVTRSEERRVGKECRGRWARSQ